MDSISQNDKLYPPTLKNLHSPPKQLYYLGNTQALTKTAIAIVGTRRNTAYGEYMTKKIVSELAILDIAIVSGLARGIDTIAHKEALKNNLPTIAVLGNGLPQIYPRSNQELGEKIVQSGGLVISEYEPNTPPLKYNFPNRNRIISGISQAVIVIEAPEKSGALITADFAINQGVELFIVPGDVDRDTSLGTLKLLQTAGANPISSGREIIEKLKTQPQLFLPQISLETAKEAPKFKITPTQNAILRNLTKTRPISLGILQNRTKIPISILMQEISILEMEGMTKQRDGKYLATY